MQSSSGWFAHANAVGETALHRLLYALYGHGRKTHLPKNRSSQMQSLLSIECTATSNPDAVVESPLPPNRESLRVLIIGSRQGVIRTIQTLYRLGFAEVGEWSPLLPAPNSGEVMSILTRYILADS
jgi:hypothetical protein